LLFSSFPFHPPLNILLQITGISPTIKIASEVGAQIKVTFMALILHMLNFGSNSVERSRSAVVMGIQSSDFVHQIAIEALPDDLLRKN